MNIKTKLSGAVLTAAFAMGTIGAVSNLQAQTADKPAAQKSIKPGKPDITINCCRCLGGKGDPVNISTGTAKWTVSKTPTAEPPMPSAGWSVGPIAVVPTNTSQQVLPGNIGPNPLPGTWTNLLGVDWLQPAANVAGTAYNSSVPNGHWTYVLKVSVPNCTVPQKVLIDGQLAADDYARMYVDYGVSGPTQTLVGTPGGGFSADGSATRSFNTTLNPSMPGGFTKPGTYFIRVELDNLGGAPAGIVLKGTLAGQCSDNLERPKAKDQKEAAAEQPAPACPEC